MESRERRLNFALPLGHLQADTLGVLREGAYQIRGYDPDARGYRPSVDDSEISLKVLRAQEVPIYVEEGFHDIGITGHDWIKETKADVEELCDLRFGGVEIVLAVPNALANVNSFEELLDKYWERGIRISTEYLRLAEEYIVSQECYRKRAQEGPSVITPWSRRITKSPVRLILSFGATEAKPPEDAEAIIDNTTSRRTLRENDLKVIDIVLASSTAKLIANKDSLKDPWKSEKIEQIRMALDGVVRARESFHIFANIPTKELGKAQKMLPAMKEVSVVKGKEWSRIDFVVPRSQYREVVVTLKRLGAQDMLRYSPGQIIP